MPERMWVERLAKAGGSPGPSHQFVGPARVHWQGSKNKFAGARQSLDGGKGQWRRDGNALLGALAQDAKPSTRKIDCVPA
jgi:hypothetical protein